MKVVVTFVCSVAAAIAGFVVLLRDGEDDIRGTYPELQRRSGKEAAVQCSLFMGTGSVAH